MGLSGISCARPFFVIGRRTCGHDRGRGIIKWQNEPKFNFKQ